MERQLIKKTRSLCPSCLREIDAELYLDGEKAVIEKKCAEHGSFSEVADTDGGLYLKCSSTKKNRPYQYGLVIPVSYACDLSCRWCYLPERGKEFTIDRIKGLIAASSARHIVFSGGEPCLRPELPDLIKYVKSSHPEKRTVLLTNGLKLASLPYAALLKDSGLDYCIFSLNGFRPSTHTTFNGRDLSSEKTQALGNLKKLKIPTILSMTLARGVNDDEFADVLRFGLANLDFIRQLRLRNVSEIGVYGPHQPIYMSDMLKAISAATRFSLEEILKENAVSNRRAGSVNYFVMNVFNILKRRSRAAAYPRLAFWKDVYSRAGAAGAFRMAFEPERPPDERTTFEIEIFSWPTSGNIDLDEVRTFPISHVTNGGETLPFWEALFRNDRDRKLTSMKTDEEQK
jgi:molybdenum cofactor biosynthesis enzyme MoaA